MNHDRKRTNESMQQIFYERIKFFADDFKILCVDGTYNNEAVVENLPYRRDGATKLVVLIEPTN